MRYLLVCLMLLFLPSGCVEGSPFKPTWHQKFNWQAEEFFDDPQVVALCKAIEANDLDEIERLVKAGADVNAQGKGNMTPLLWALPDNKPERFGKLLEMGADPNVIFESDFNTKMSGIVPGDSVTHLVCRTHFPGYFELVFDHGGDPNLVHPVSKDTPLTALITGSSVDRKKKLRTLIELGADVDHVNRLGSPPVITAVAHFGQYDLALMLLEVGANHKIYIENQNTRLVHIVYDETSGRRTRVMTPQQQADYNRLVEWLEDHGESLDEAKADWERWRSSGAFTFEQKRKLREAEIAERKAREQQEAEED